MSQQPINLESEQFLAMLSEALRAGPASPQWHQAVGLLRAQSGGEADEYKLLCTAREDLESGKEYKSVRAGAEFSHRVIAGLGQQGGRRPSTAAIITGISAILIAIVISIVGYYIYTDSQPQKIKLLTSQLYYNPVVEARFESALPPGWQPIGDVPVVVRDKELRPGAPAATTPATTAPTVQSCGLVCTQELPADGEFEIKAVFKLSRALQETGAIRLFIADDPVTSAHLATERQLVCQLQNGEVRVVLPGSQKTLTQIDAVGNSREVTVRIVLGRDLAVVDSRDSCLYAGENRLSPKKPRYLGILFVRRAGEKWDQMGVASITIRKP
jgi:hypothetical protein